MEQDYEYSQQKISSEKSGCEMGMNVGKENKEGYKRKEKKWIGERVVYDISSCSETERRNEMTLKAAFIYIITKYNNEGKCKSK